MSRIGKSVALQVLVGGFGLVSGVALWAYTANSSLPSRVYLGTLPLSGTSSGSLEERLQALQATLAELPAVPEQAPEQSAPLRAWGVQLDVPATAEVIQQAWSALPVWERLWGKKSVRVNPVWHLDTAQFEHQLRQYQSLERVAKDARVRYREGQVVIEPSMEGRRIDPKRTASHLRNALNTHLHRAHEALHFALAFEPEPPRIPTETVLPITDVLASYTTRFPKSQVQRNHNIRLAGQALDGRILLPSERLSFNAVVGRRTVREGYKLAPVIVNGKKQLGIGGGVCQVSSTLFNSALLADLKIVRRANHSIPVAYVPLGRDATVTDNGYDLVIENPHPYPVALSVEIGRSSITIRILGKPEPAKRVVLTTERSWVGKGTRVVLWRWVYQGRQLVRRERVAVSFYRPEPAPASSTSQPRPKPAPSAPASTSANGEADILL